MNVSCLTTVHVHQEQLDSHRTSEEASRIKSWSKSNSFAFSIMRFGQVGARIFTCWIACSYDNIANYLASCKQSECRVSPVVTFDDGHLTNYEVALPLLQNYGLTARFFITVGWTGQKPGYMGWEDLRKLHNSGQKIGAHGWSHALLTRCSPSALEMELTRPRLILEDKLGVSITTMSFPGGRYNKRVIAACAAAGYKQVYTSEPQMGGGACDVLGGAAKHWGRRDARLARKHI